MKKQKVMICGLLTLCVLLLASCTSFETMLPFTENSERRDSEGKSSVSEGRTIKEESKSIDNKWEESENSVGDEEQQLLELEEALGKLKLEYIEVKEFGEVLIAYSPYCDKNETEGKSCVMPFMYIFGPSSEPVLGIAFNYIADDYMGMDTIEIDTEKYRYTYNSDTFLAVGRENIAVGPNQVKKTEEGAVHIATADDVDTLVDILDSDKVGLRFGKFNSVKPQMVEVEMPIEDKQAITDVWNAYYLYLNTTQVVRAKALGALNL